MADRRQPTSSSPLLSTDGTGTTGYALLLCIPELERACQISKESLAASRQAAAKKGGGRGDAEAQPGFNLLMELLRGDH